MIRKLRRLSPLLVLVFVVAAESWAAADTVGGEPPSVEAVIGMINEYCGSCHGVPPPNSMVTATPTS